MSLVVDPMLRARGLASPCLLPGLVGPPTSAGQNNFAVHLHRASVQVVSTSKQGGGVGVAVRKMRISRSPSDVHPITTDSTAR